jgi:lysophospholipase L1-like esterase
MKTIHIVGDSISIHYGPYLEKYSGRRCHYSRKEGVAGNLDDPEGANGGDSAMVLAYLRQCISEGSHWDILVVNCGLHDIKRYAGSCQISSVEYERHLQQIFEQAGKLCNQIIWMRTTPVVDEIHHSRLSEFERFNADVEKYNALADRIAGSKRAPIIDLNAFCQSLGGSEIYQDHVHFINEVQMLQGAFIAGHLIAWMDLQPTFT